MTIRVLGLKSDYTSAESHRLGLSTFMAPAGARFDRRSGIVPDDGDGAADLAGTAGTMQAVVKPFSAWIDGTSAAAQGGYPFVSDSDVPLVFDAGEPSVARVDRVIARVKDDPYDASGVQDGFVEILKGQSNGAASPLPPTCLLLWEVTVPAGASAGGGGINWATARADRRQPTWALGATGIVRNAVERDGLSTYEGLSVWRSDYQARQVFAGGMWRWRDPISVGSAAERDAIGGGVFVGGEVWRRDLGVMETWNGTGWVRPWPSLIRKNADQSVVNSNVFVEDNELVLPVPGNGGFMLSGVLFYSAHQDADLKIGWNGPPNAWMDWTCRALHGSSTTTSGAQFVDRQFITGNPGMGGAAANNTVQLTATLNGLLGSGDGGTLRLRMAQTTAHATASIMRAGSFFSLQRVW